MALVRWILGKFLGVVCHCFPHITYNIQKFLVLPTAYIFVRDPRTNMNYFSVQHCLIGSYNRGVYCAVRTVSFILFFKDKTFPMYVKCTWIRLCKTRSRPYNFIALHCSFFLFMVLCSAWWWLYVAETCSCFTFKTFGLWFCILLFLYMNQLFSA
jgi:hypothetical protein